MDPVYLSIAFACVLNFLLGFLGGYFVHARQTARERWQLARDRERLARKLKGEPSAPQATADDYMARWRKIREKLKGGEFETLED
jgi:hypothetical protein